MMKRTSTIESLLETPAKWLSGTGPRADMVLCTQAFLVRNLADFPFLDKALDDEKSAVESRILGAVHDSGLLADGQYMSFEEVSPLEMRFLAERRLASVDLLGATGPRGVFCNPDQGVNLMVNGTNHLCMQVNLPGFQPREAWERLNAMDDALAELLDFAFDERFGFLGPDLRFAGTGLRVFCVLHLPGLAMAHQLAHAEKRARDERMGMRALTTRDRQPGAENTGDVVADAFYLDLGPGGEGDADEAPGFFMQIFNEYTLGHSEQEIAYELRHAALAIVDEERRKRDELMDEGMRQLEDHVGRATGLVHGARMLDFAEGVSLLSSLRLGVALGMVGDYTFRQIDDLLLAAQRSHIELRAGHGCDEMALSSERADLFRSRFL